VLGRGKREAGSVVTVISAEAGGDWVQRRAVPSLVEAP
jgi:hypothetical protein